MKNFIFSVILLASSSLVFLFTFQLPLETTEPVKQVSAQTINSDWPQLQYDSSKTGFTPTSSISAPYSIAWRWHPSLIDPALKKVSISGRVQMVVGSRLTCAGYYNGTMYCLDKDSGNLVWQYQTKGPITHSAAIVNNKVVFGSADHHIYAVNTTDGSLAWKFKTGKSIQNAPCINNNTVYIGSGDGNMYALDLNTGQQVWRYNSKYPIITSAACTNSTVYFGNESVSAYALSASNGSLEWKKQLKGSSLAGYWPVVSESNSVVFFRTRPQREFHRVLGDGDSIIESQPADKTTANISAEQTAIRNHLDQKNNSFETFWALDTNTGTKKYTAPVLYTSGEGEAPVPPVVDTTRNQGYLVWRTRYFTFGCFGSCVRPYVDISKFNLTTGEITHFNGPNKGGVHLIGDENTILSAHPNKLLVYGRGTLGEIDLTNEDSGYISNSLRGNETDYWNGDVSPFAYDQGWTKGDILGGGGNGANYIAPVSMAGDKIYWVARYGMLVATQGQ